jgi:uncharacterized membrane protein
MNYPMPEGAQFYSQMKRFIEFDVLRGVLLLMMSVDHSSRPSASPANRCATLTTAMKS